MSAEMQKEADAHARLRETLAGVPFVTIGAVETPPPGGLPGSRHPEFLLPVQAGTERWRLACEVRYQAQPRQVRTAVLELKDCRSDRAGPGVWSTGLVQTYLDLCAAGERGAEAAEYLRQTSIGPLWKPAG